MNTKTISPGRQRGNRLLREHVHDPYRTARKPTEPTVCPTCNAVFGQGHWRWKETWPADAHKELCPACRRTRDGYPAGIVTMTGSFARTHKSELLQLARHQEQLEKAEHPLHRIMKIEDSFPTIVISTTDIHLPKRIADAVHHACKGELEARYEERGYLVRINWKRDN